MRFLKGKKHKLSNSSDKFTKTLEEINQQINNLETTNEEINKLMLLVLDGTNPELIQIAKNTLEDKISENQKSSLIIRNDLKRELIKLDDPNNDAQSENTIEKTHRRDNNETRIRKQQIANQSRRFYILLEEHHNQLDHYKSKSKELLMRQVRIVNANISEEEIETVLTEGNTQIFNSSIIDETCKARQQLNAIEERHNEFLQLENSVREVNELFVELSIMVEQQGETLDRIDMAVGDAEIVVQEGTEQIKQGHRKKKKNRKIKTKLTIGGVVSAVVTTIIIIAVV